MNRFAAALTLAFAVVCAGVFIGQGMERFRMADRSIVTKGAAFGCANRLSCRFVHIDKVH